MQPSSPGLSAFVALLLGALPVAAALSDELDDIESYFRYPLYAGWNLAHTILMVLAWVIAMPLAIILSTARSRYHLPAQIFFHILNGMGILTATVYHASTPDLYPNNAHHGLGWVVAGFTGAWTLASFCVAYGEHKNKLRTPQEGRKLRTAQFRDVIPSRNSNELSGNNEHHMESLLDSRQNSLNSVYQKPGLLMDEEDFDRDRGREAERQGFLADSRVETLLSKSIRNYITQRSSAALRFCHIVLEKILLLLGFAALTSGFIVSGGLFRDGQIFNGLAHYIKGGIFVWYGILTLGRWMGAFAEIGWAWNVRPHRPLVPRWKVMVPSAEFTESFVIWTYGASNVFLEHLSNPGGDWTPSDLEHVSITILFFGGGLLGMLVDSKLMRDLANKSVRDHKSGADHPLGHSHLDADRATKEPHDHEQRWKEPETNTVPLNPMPSLTIMLLGMMMGAHHQESMVSAMLHAQWGGLFSAFALARGVTYVTLYLKPPTSYLPARPPSEVVASFCLCAGGILFMNSAADIVLTIESNGLDAMTVFTLSMGLTGIVLAWEVVLFAIKGWAMRNERAP